MGPAEFFLCLISVQVAELEHVMEVYKLHIQEMEHNIKINAWHS